MVTIAASLAASTLTKMQIFGHVLKDAAEIILTWESPLRTKITCTALKGAQLKAFTVITKVFTLASRIARTRNKKGLLKKKKR